MSELTKHQAVEEHLIEKFRLFDPHLDQAAGSVHDNNLPDHAVSPLQGQFLFTLARSINARQIVEVGTLAGYSTIWLARAVGLGGRVISFESDAKAFQIALNNIRKAGLQNIVELVHAPAWEALQTTYNHLHPVDLVFMDGDKPNYVNYLKWALDHSRPGGLIIADNVIRDGRIFFFLYDDLKVEAVKAYLAALTREKSLTTSILPLVGIKPYDGMAISLIDPK